MDARPAGRPDPMQRARVLAPLTLLFLAACGGGGDDSGSAAPSPAPPGPSPSPSPPAPAPLPAVAATAGLDDNHQVGNTHWPDGATLAGGQGQPVGSLACGTEGEAYHVHSHLSIFVDGVGYAVPADIGLSQTGGGACHYNLHTHDRSGKLHVEANNPFTATLGQFFAIWGQPLARDNVAGFTGKPIEFFVTENRVVTRHAGDPAAIELTSHRHIAIQIGTAVAEVPFFTWTAS